MDDDTPDIDVAGIETADVTVTEGDDAVFTVTVTDAAAGSTVMLALADGTAIDADYNEAYFQYSTDSGGTWTDVAGAISVTAGDSTLLVKTDTYQDLVDESDETFTLTGTLTSLGTDYSDTATATIVDDDELAVGDTVSDDDDAGVNTVAAPFITHTGTISPIGDGLTFEIVDGETVFQSNGVDVITEWTGGDTLTGKAGSVTVFTIVVSGTGYTFTQFEAIDHDLVAGENDLIATFTAQAMDGSNPIPVSSNTFDVTINDSIVKGPGSDMIIEANSPFSLTSDLTGITLSEDETSATWNLSSMPTDLTYGGDPITFTEDSSGHLIGSANGTDVFDVSIDLSGATPQYTFDLKVGPIGTPVIYDNFAEISGGNVGELLLNFEDAVIAHLTATDGSGASTVNTNNTTIGIGGGQRINPGETLFMSFSDPDTTLATTVGGLNFTAEYSGSNNDIEVEWTAICVAGLSSTTVTGSASTLDGLLEFSIEPPAGYTIESATIDSPDDGDYQGNFKLAFTIDGDATYEDMNFDLPYILTDYDGDATDGVISVNLDSDLDNPLYSDDGDDVMVTGADDDVIDSDDGNDVISSGAGDDIINAGDGNDYIDGGAGVDEIDGGAGDDTIVFDAADSHVDGGLGSDTLQVDGTEYLDFSKVDNIEKIELTGDTQTVNLTAAEVLDMTDANNLLQIQGGDYNNDTVELDSSWSQDTTNVNVFNFGTAASLTVFNVTVDIDGSTPVQIDDSGDIVI